MVNNIITVPFHATFLFFTIWRVTSIFQKMIFHPPFLFHVLNFQWLQNRRNVYHLLASYLFLKLLTFLKHTLPEIHLTALCYSIAHWDTLVMDLESQTVVASSGVSMREVRTAPYAPYPCKASDHSVANVYMHCSCVIWEYGWRITSRWRLWTRPYLLILTSSTPMRCLPSTW